MGSMRILDSDGHVMEDQPGIAKFLPSHYPPRRGNVFPALDHMHGTPYTTRPGAFQQGVGPKEWVQFLDEVGMERTVLYPTGALAYGRIVDRDWAIAVGHAYNEWLTDAYLSKSPRLHGMGLIPMQEPEAAVEELRHLVKDLGMPGAMLPSTGLKDHLGAKEYWPVYAEAERLGCALSIHGGAHSGLGFDHMNVFAPAHALGHPLGVMINFVGMVANGVFERFPGLRVAFLEGGVAWLPFALERMNGSYGAFRPFNPRGELLQLEQNETVSDRVRKHVKAGKILVGCEGDEPALPFAIELVGAEAFLYSSDFPHEVDAASCKEELEELMENEKLTKVDKEAILSKNAEKFYRLQPAPVPA